MAAVDDSTAGAPAEEDVLVASGTEGAPADGEDALGTSAAAAASSGAEAVAASSAESAAAGLEVQQPAADAVAADADAAAVAGVEGTQVEDSQAAPAAADEAAEAIPIATEAPAGSDTAVVAESEDAVAATVPTAPDGGHEAAPATPREVAAEQSPTTEAGAPHGDKVSGLSELEGSPAPEAEPDGPVPQAAAPEEIVVSADATVRSPVAAAAAVLESEPSAELTTSGDATGAVTTSAGADIAASPVAASAGLVSKNSSSAPQLNTFYIDVSAEACHIFVGRLSSSGAVGIEQLEIKVSPLQDRLEDCVVRIRDELAQLPRHAPPACTSSVVVGLGPWYRGLSSAQAAPYVELWNELRRMASELQPGAAFHQLDISGEDLAEFENAAATYALQRSLNLGIPDLLLGMSTDLVHIRSAPQHGGSKHCFSLRLEQGEAMIASGSNEWEQVCRATCQSELTTLIQWFSASVPQNDSAATAQSSLHLVATAECCHAASSAGLLPERQSGPLLLSSEDVLSKLQEGFFNTDAPAKERANIARLQAAIESVFGSESNARFRGDSKLVFPPMGGNWRIDSMPFQMHWAAGHFIKELAAMRSDTNKVQPSSSAKQATVLADEPSNKMSKVASKLPLKSDARGPPGLIIYLVVPVAVTVGEATLSHDEYQAISTAALRSGATIILSASDLSLVTSMESETMRMGKILRPLIEFANNRFRSPGVKSDPKSVVHLFDALDLNDSGTLDSEEIAVGLRGLGFPGDAALAAITLTPVGTRLSRDEFCEVLSRVAQQPDIVVACLATETNQDVWPMARALHTTDGDLFSESALAAKTDEAQRLAGHGSTSYGIIIALTARGRSSLPSNEYERQMRAELAAVQRTLPVHWPLLWSPSPAELGLLPALPPTSSHRSQQRAVWELPKTAGVTELVGWLRYLLVVRPSAPAG